MRWSDQQQLRQDQHDQQTYQQPAPQLLLKRAAADDIVDVAATLVRHSGGTFGC